MKLIVFSDSHGTYDNMKNVIQQEKPDAMLYLGDGLRDCAAIEGLFPELPVHKVYGNCDIGPSRDIPIEQDLVFEGYHFFITHGHKYNVKTGLFEITREAKDRNADIVLFGHTHQVFVERSGNLWICNPGSISFMGGETYAAIHLDEAGIFISLERA